MEIKVRSEKRSSVITDLALCLDPSHKEKDRSTSAFDISNVQQTTSRKCMLGKESISHAPKASRRVLGISLFLFGIPTYLYVYP